MHMHICVYLSSCPTCTCLFCVYIYAHRHIQVHILVFIQKLPQRCDIYSRVCMCVKCVCVCVRACVRACVRCMCVCAYAYTCAKRQIYMYVFNMCRKKKYMKLPLRHVLLLTNKLHDVIFIHARACMYTCVYVY